MILHRQCNRDAFPTAIGIRARPGKVDPRFSGRDMIDRMSVPVMLTRDSEDFLMPEDDTLNLASQLAHAWLSNYELSC